MTPVLHPYQDYAKNFVITHPKCGLFLDMGLGKAIDDDTLLPTPAGLRRAGDIQPGDLLFSMRGTATRVQAVFKHPGKNAFKVTLEDGRSFICCDEHLIPLLKPGTESITAVTLDQIMDSYRTEKEDGTVSYSYAIPWTEPVDYPRPNRPYDGRILGAAARLMDSTKTEFNPDNLPEWARPAWDGLSAEARGELTRDLGSMDGETPGLPQWLIETDAIFKAEFLAGFAGCDLRDIAVMRKRKTLDYETTHETVARQLCQIAWSMGHLAVTKYRPRKKLTEISIAVSRNETRKQGLKIVDIKAVGIRNMTCFTVDDYTHTYLINDYLVTHNTLITLMALWQAQPSGHILVVAPKTVASSTWQNEIDKWGIPVRTQSLIVNERGNDLSKKKRLKLIDETLETPSSMYFINRELFTSLVDNLPMVHGEHVWPFNTIIIDELQSFKNYTSQRTKALIKVAPIAERFIGLTGTPTPKDLMDLWSEIHFMDNGERLGKTITAYRRRWFRSTLIVNNYPVGWVPLPGAEDEIYSRISDLVISIKNPNIKLPPITYNDVHIKLSADEMKLYKNFAKESALELADGNVVTAKNAGQLRIKLTQMASGTLYTEKGDPTKFMVIHEKKLDMCEYIINNSSHGTIVAYQFQADRAMLKKRFPDAVIFDGSAQMQADWNDGKIPILLLNPASAGHGLNIQEGGHTLIWYTTPMNLEHYLQCNARLYRQGQKYPVTIHHLIADGTVDKANMALIASKDQSEAKLIDAVQAAVDEAISP